MKIADILKALYFPSSQLTPSPELLANNILRSIQKDWKIKILILSKQHQTNISFHDLKELEGQSLSTLLKKDGIVIEELSEHLTIPIAKDLKKLISHHALIEKQEILKRIQHHLTKSIAQVLIDNTEQKRTSTTLGQTLMTYLPLQLTSSRPKEFYCIPESNHAECLRRCKKIIKSVVTPNFSF